ncbi:hypothetical protein C8R43DRAFT_127536 [Mycena crocata]|nr:hypothetical protein C8R43DRAFT_127536 [Mycena crocata]
MSTLPGELVDSILDLVHVSSPTSLTACALVCREWLPRSRYHHFASIILRRDRSTDRVNSFLKLIASPLVTFISSIREVHLYHRPSYGSPVLSPGDIIALLARAGVQPTHLHLNCQFNQLIHGVQRTSFASLTHLRLTLCNEIPLEKMFDHLRAFPSLQSLTLQLQEGQEAGRISIDSRTRPVALPASLRELEVVQPDILRSLVSLENPPSQFTGLILRQVDEWDDVNLYLRNMAISQCLTSLTLESCYTARDIQDGGLDLRRLSALRHLHIQEDPRWIANTALSVLAKLQTPAPLEAIRLNLRIGGSYKHIGLQIFAAWSDVDTLLTGAESRVAFPHLRRVVVSAYQNRAALDIPAIISRAVRKNMPLCDARGILFIQV